MKVLTETQIRAKLKKEDVEEFIVNPDTIVTPSAREYLSEKNIKLVFDGEGQKSSSKAKVSETTEESSREEFIPRYKSKDTGGYFDQKPENMTQLYGNELVLKNHPSIIFRGKLDSLQSKILEAQIIAHKNKCKKLIEELQEILQYIRNILKAEVINEEMKNINLLGLKEEEIREISHNPKKHLGVDHLLPSYGMGEIVIILNSIRSQVRETELTSIPLERQDLIRALNRLSSAIYVMMCRYIAGYYN